MKKLAYILAAIAVLFCGCNKDDDEKGGNDPLRNSDSYTVKYDNHTIAAGDTVKYNPTATELENEFVHMVFFILNKTSESLSTAVKMEMLQGPDSYKSAGICLDECQNGICPFSCTPYPIGSGVEKQLELEMFPSASEGSQRALYRVTVGKGAELGDPPVFFIQLN